MSYFACFPRSRSLFVETKNFMASCAVLVETLAVHAMFLSDAQMFVPSAFAYFASATNTLWRATITLRLVRGFLRVPPSYQRRGTFSNTSMSARIGLSLI